MELITLKNIDGIYPRYLYKRLTVDSAVKMTFAYKIDYGFGYLLRRIRVKYPDLNQPALFAPPAIPTTEFTPWTLGTMYAAGDIVYDPAQTGGTTTPWTTITPFVAGDIIYAPSLTSMKNPPVFVCTVGGITGIPQPAWNMASGGLTVDGLATWKTFYPLKNPPVFMCTVGGISGAAAPAWNMLRGGLTPEGAGLLVWQNLDLAQDCGHFVNDLELSIIDQANDNPRQPSPVKVDLMASPGRSGTLFKNTNIPALTGVREIAWTSNPALFSSTLNFLYRYNDLIWIDFSNIEYVNSITAPDGNIHAVTPFFSPSYIDVFLEGYYVPEKAFDLWKGARL